MKDASPTDPAVIEKAVKIGKLAGLKYVYAGNLPYSHYENTYCPRCGEIVIERIGYIARRLDSQGVCPKCKTKIDLILE